MTTATIDTPAFRALALEWAESNVKEAAPKFERLVAHIETLLEVARLDAQMEVHGLAHKAITNLMAERDMYRSRSATLNKDSAPTDLSNRLRALSESPITQLVSMDHAKIMFQAAEEIERYYGGMMNWKMNAQQKDRNLIDQHRQLEAQNERLVWFAQQNNIELKYDSHQGLYWIEWPHFHNTKTAMYPTPQEAIDAGREMEAESNRANYSNRQRT